jgi:hypothetical protein
MPCLKFLNVCQSAATKILMYGRSKINWITSKIKRIDILKIKSRHYVPRICTFKYWHELQCKKLGFESTRHSDYQSEIFTSPKDISLAQFICSKQLLILPLKIQ